MTLQKKFWNDSDILILSHNEFRRSGGKKIKKGVLGFFHF